MISRAEVLSLRGEWQVDAQVIEKDHALGWLLAGIANEPRLASWVFKGGTCLRKCYFETYRFSEDLDFTVLPGGVIDPAELEEIFHTVATWVREESGVEFIVDPQSFRARRNLRGNATTHGALAFRGPLAQPMPVKIKIDLSADELVALPPEPREVAHPYGDAVRVGDSPSVCVVRSYPLVELFAEKLRALAQRCRPRDLYDVVHTHRHADVAGRADEVAAVLARKCSFVGIEPPTAATIRASGQLDELVHDWNAMLAHQLPQLPDPQVFLTQLDEVFAWLAGQRAVTALRSAPIDSGDVAVRPRSTVRWRAGAPIELLRFAGANRLRVDVDYRAANGRWGWRRVEAYALRRTSAGALVVFVVNERGLPRTYRLDRIRDIRVTGQPFIPRYRIEM